MSRRRSQPASLPPEIGTGDFVPQATSSRGRKFTFTLALLHPEEHAFRDATTQILHWRVTAGQRRPDGVLKRVYLINDAFPGPTIEARSGDRLIIHVENALDDDEGLSIHAHGLSMRGTNDMDGAVGITQDSILAGSTFTYNFAIDSNQHGTFWYHSHFAEQRADGFYGGLIVHQPRSEAPSTDLALEHLLLVGDWYHRTAVEALVHYMHPGAFGLETVPDSILVNGRGAYRCSDAVPARPVDCQTVDTMSIRALDLDTARKTVLRVVNVGAYAGFEISVLGAVLTPLTVDGGHDVKGSAAKKVGFLHPGERMSLLVEQNSVAIHHEATLVVTLDEDPFKYENSALTPSHSFPVQWHGDVIHQPETERAVYELFDIQDVTAAHDQSEKLPSTADQTIILYTTTQKLAHLDNEPHGFINNTLWTPQSPPLIGLPRDEWNKHQLVPEITYNEASPLWVDIVLNNLDEDWHPFHLHGNDFWVLSKYSSPLNWGSYNPYEDASPPGGRYDLVGAMKRDTFYVPRRGYAVLRFRADNPGLWMMHCHVLWHQASGMAMAFDVR
ncbi:multicopper oxidase [Zasmidium cellare ATCC 36951]|uniref:Multicopper oxidase n=1 Tax=Zasmidium cellare ATCC 36951 TaxID=1080233 RepID=A0A6A6C8T0_ZASCE|nr:multicopper oxidase [Zasmidium cellare ATCC 36951]KAF2162658.1 multicopper oxidase [Zasmidium cellare ATCC 36951]